MDFSGFSQAISRLFIPFSEEKDFFVSAQRMRTQSFSEGNVVSSGFFLARDKFSSDRSGGRVGIGLPRGGEFGREGPAPDLEGIGPIWGIGWIFFLVLFVVYPLARKWGYVLYFCQPKAVFRFSLFFFWLGLVWFRLSARLRPTLHLAPLAFPLAQLTLIC